MRLVVSLVLVVLDGCTNNDDVLPPQIATVQPDHGLPSAIVAIVGSFFCQLPPDDEVPECETIGTVSFDTTPATTSMWSDTAIMVEVPEGMVGEVRVTVDVHGRTSKGIGFTID